MKPFNEIYDILKSYLLNYPNRNLFISDLDYYLSVIGSIKSSSYKIIKFQSEWLNTITKLSENYENCYNFSLSNVFYSYNKHDLYSEKLWYLGGVRYSPFASGLIAKEIKNILNTFQVARKKCLVLDLDNTLWGGVLGDDGVNGIKLDKTGFYSCYYDFQKEIKKIKETGVILVIASKNNLDIVIDVLNNHPNMILKEEDFSIIMANWKPKSENILEISKKINISTNSMVMIDDSKFEQEEILNSIQDIVVPEFPKDPVLLRKFALDIFHNYFQLISTNQSDLSKAKQIKAKINFDSDKEKSQNIDVFLRSLNMRLEISINDTNNIDRLSQISQKTNQFNLSGKRYTSQQILELIQSKKLVFCGRFIDKYGDHGIVLLAIISLESERAVLENLYMSCRIFGRNLEYDFMYGILNILKNHGVKSLLSKYIKSDRNDIVLKFYADMGFEKSISSSKINKIHFNLDLLKLSKVVGFSKVVINES
jgi:FkbH-like protein